MSKGIKFIFELSDKLEVSIIHQNVMKRNLKIIGKTNEFLDIIENKALKNNIHY